MHKVSLPLVIVAFQIFFAAPLSGTWFPNRKKVHMHIIDKCPDTPTPLRLHCKSGKEDRDPVIVYNGGDESWEFKTDPAGKTLWFCGFNWGKRKAVFDIFNKTFSENCNNGAKKSYTCYWVVAPDGFYISSDNLDFTMMNVWSY